MRNNESGQAIVEFSIVFVILIILFIGTIDVGRTIYMSMNMNLLTQESVRLGSLGYDDAYIRQYVTDNFKLGDTSKIVTNITPTDSFRESGDYIEIGIQYEMDYFMPGIGLVLPDQVESNSTMRVE